MITGSELISDSYDLKEVKEVNGILWEADCDMIQVGGETFGKPGQVWPSWVVRR